MASVRNAGKKSMMGMNTTKSEILFSAKHVYVAVIELPKLMIDFTEVLSCKLTL